jgi:hypothetical protein
VTAKDTNDRTDPHDNSRVHHSGRDGTALPPAQVSAPAGNTVRETDPALQIRRARRDSFWEGRLDEQLMDLVRAGAVRDSPRLRDLGLAALARVTGESSEWQELWSESESPAEADAVIADLRSALA